MIEYIELNCFTFSKEWDEWKYTSNYPFITFWTECFGDEFQGTTLIKKVMSVYRRKYDYKLFLLNKDIIL